jgi:large subunit ribosomal protein L25
LRAGRRALSSPPFDSRRINDETNMQTQALTAEVRHEGGKGPSRQLRMKGLIPAVFYGPGTEPTRLAVSPKDLRKALSTDLGRNQVIELSIAGKKELALVRDLQIHPVERDVIHVDFYRVELGRAVLVDVPFETKGKAVGVTEGGELHVIFRRIPVKALPDKVPVKIVVEVSHLAIGDVIHVKEVAVPEGVTIALGPERTVVACAAERKYVEEEVAPVAGAAAVPGAPGAAPAAGAAPGAAGAAAPAAGAAAAPAAAAKKDDKKDKKK